MNEKQMENMAREHTVSGVDVQAAEGIAKAAVGLVQTTAESVTSGYKKIENAVVTGYKKIENGAVEGFDKVVDKCVEVLFAVDGESVEDARKRLSGKEGK